MLSPDSCNRFLLREEYTPYDLYRWAAQLVTVVGGVVSVDDTVLDKPYSFVAKYVGFFWSGKHKRSVKGINLITLYYTDVNGVSVPVNYRLYDKEEGKTKNEYFRDMLAEVIAWGLRPAYVTGDSWYSGLDNLKYVRDGALGFLVGIESNRLVAVTGRYQQVQTLAIPPDGLVVMLKGFGPVRVFRTVFKDGYRYYILHLPADGVVAPDFQSLHDTHWHIEQFQVRTPVAIKNHIFSALCAYLFLEKLRVKGDVLNHYATQRSLFEKVIADFIGAQQESVHEFFSPHFCSLVNA